MYNQTPSPADQQAALRSLTSVGVTKVDIAFSGGNDEGGADGIEYWDVNGDEVTAVPKSKAYNESGSTFNRDTNKFVPNPPRWVVYGQRGDDKRDATTDEVAWAKVAGVLESPIYERWGSFAGEFYVNGTLTWDVAAGTYRLNGQESVEHYEDFEDFG